MTGSAVAAPFPLCLVPCMTSDQSQWIRACHNVTAGPTRPDPSGMKNTLGALPSPVRQYVSEQLQPEA
jgi:hypothetical protein